MDDHTTKVEETKMLESFIKPRRLSKGYSLRNFADKIRVNASFYSKIERGVVPFPEGNDLQQKIASVLEIQNGSPEWVDFSIAISLNNGNIPKDSLNDENLAKILPVFFRTINGGKPSEADLKALITFIRKQYEGSSIDTPAN